jgi:glycosyltransferase involved in cell wall biosynthesis
LHEKVSVSARRTILLKGYQHWAGRALVGLQALTMCAGLLKGYQVAIYSAEKDVEIAAKLFEHDTGIPVIFIRNCSHDEMLRWYGRSRIYIGLSISDGISTSLLEAIVMGAFPIQSCTACADEWLENGKSGFIVPPEEPQMIADAIRKALTDDELVNHAAEINAQTVAQRLDYSIIKKRVIEIYQEIYDIQKE